MASYSPDRSTPTSDKTEAVQPIPLSTSLRYAQDHSASVISRDQGESFDSGVRPAESIGVSYHVDYDLSRSE